MTQQTNLYCQPYSALMSLNSIISENVSYVISWYIMLYYDYYIIRIVPLAQIAQCRKWTN